DEVEHRYPDPLQHVGGFPVVELEEQAETYVRAHGLPCAEQVLERDGAGIAEHGHRFGSAALDLGNDRVDQRHVAGIIARLEEPNCNARCALAQLAVSSAPGLKRLPIGEDPAAIPIGVVVPEIERE